jgi:hypothetical protein
MVTQTSLADICCQLKDPCEVYCLLENAHIRMMLGETVSSIQIGAEKYTYMTPNPDGLLRLKAHYGALCEQAGGTTNEIKRRSFCFEFGDHNCRTPHGGCGC